eukprot:758876-Hanusia_phi.AAC.2
MRGGGGDGVDFARIMWGWGRKEKSRCRGKAGLGGGGYFHHPHFNLRIPRERWVGCIKDLLQGVIGRGCFKQPGGRVVEELVWGNGPSLIGAWRKLRGRMKGGRYVCTVRADFESYSKACVWFVVWGDDLQTDDIKFNRFDSLSKCSVNLC